MTPSLRERIQSTLNRYHAWVISLDEATDDILLAIKEARPEKREFEQFKEREMAWTDGWNACLEEMERRLV